MADTEIQGFQGLELTKKGLRLLAKVQAGQTKLELTRPVIGDAYLPDGQDVLDLTALVNEITTHQTGTESSSATADITYMDVADDGTMLLKVQIKNGDTGFYFRELGIMAKDPDEGEILYAYDNCGDGANGGIPPYDGRTHVIREIDIPFIITNLSEGDISVNITLPAEVTHEEFDKKITALDSRLSVLESNQTEYGIRWVTGASNPTAERCMKQEGILLTGTATGLTFSVNSDGSFKSSYDNLPIWGEMERVTISNQVMVRVPRYYIKRETTDGHDYIWVCRSKKTGYRCAGIFLSDDGTAEKDYYYIGAYESGNGALGLSQSGMKYDSDEKPYNKGYTITEYRDAAKKLGNGWGITTIAEVCDFWQVIPVIEFGTRDAQSVAAGIVGIVDPPVDDYFPDQKYRTGMCDNVTGLSGIYSLCTTSPSGSTYNYDGQTGLNCGGNPFVYRGIENPYGCIEKYVDGLTLYNKKWYVCNNRSAFATDSITGYTELDYTSPTYINGSNTYPYGYIKSMTGFDNAPYCMLPSEIDDGGATKTYYSDYFEYGTTANKYLYAGFGGGYGAGPWYLIVGYTSSDGYGYVGSRLSYSPV